MSVRVGMSVAERVGDAVREAVGGALSGGAHAAQPVPPGHPGHPGHPSVAFVFSTDQYPPTELADAIGREMWGVPWAGCSSAGVFAGAKLLKRGLVIGALELPGLRVGIGAESSVGVDPRAAGARSVRAAIAELPVPKPDRFRAIVLLLDAFIGNAADVVRGAAQEAGTGPLWAGGGAGDNLRYVRAVQFARGHTYSDAVVAIVLDSPRPLGIGIRHGWHPYGRPVLVTHAYGSVVSELEYERAFDVYRRTAEKLGDSVSPAQFRAFAMSHPLGIPQAGGEHVIRDPLSVDADGSLRCVAEIPEGSVVRLMEGGRDALLDAAFGAAQRAHDGVHGRVDGALVFDCVSRSEMLGDSVKDELARFQMGLGQDVPLFGCLTFGEVGTIGSGLPQFHNKTAVVLAIGT